MKRNSMTLSKRLWLSAAGTLCCLGFSGTAPADYDYNKALQLDGSGDFVQVHSSYVPQMTTPFYVDAWFRTGSAAPDQAIVSQYRAYSNSNLDDVFLLSVHNGRARFQINPGNRFVILDGNRLVNDGNWHHVAAGYNGSLMWMMVDGYSPNEDLVQLTTSGALNHAPGTHLRIGALYDARFGGPGFFFDGEIDEVRIWDGPTTDVTWQQWIPYRQGTQVENVRLAWRFNGYPDTGYNAAFHGNALEVDAHDRPHANPASSPNTNTALGLGVAEPRVAGDYVHVLGGASLNTGNRLTVEAVYASTSCSGQGNRLQSLVSKFKHNSGTIDDDAYFLGVEPSGHVRFQLSNGSWWRMIHSATPINDGLHHHVAGVYDGAEMRLYIDGTLEARTSFSGHLAGERTNLLLGAGYQVNTLDYFMCGLLDDVRVWDVPRSEAQIITNGNRLLDSARPVGWWNFEGDFINLSQYRGFARRYWGLSRNRTLFVPVGQFHFEWVRPIFEPIWPPLQPKGW